jgi:hypothetical protein
MEFFCELNTLSEIRRREKRKEKGKKMRKSKREWRRRR